MHLRQFSIFQHQVPSFTKLPIVYHTALFCILLRRHAVLFSQHHIASPHYREGLNLTRPCLSTNLRDRLKTRFKFEAPSRVLSSDLFEVQPLSVTHFYRQSPCLVPI